MSSRINKYSKIPKFRLSQFAGWLMFPRMRRNKIRKWKITPQIERKHYTYFLSFSLKDAPEKQKSENSAVKWNGSGPDVSNQRWHGVFQFSPQEPFRPSIRTETVQSDSASWRWELRPHALYFPIYRHKHTRVPLFMCHSSVLYLVF